MKRRAYVLLCTAALIAGAVAEYYQDPSADDPTYNSKQHIAQKAANVTIVNFTPHRCDLMVGAAYMLHHRKENVTLYFAQEKSVLQHMGVLDWLDKITLGHIKQTGKDAVMVSDMLIFISPEANPDLAREFITKANAKAVLAFIYDWEAPFASQLIHLQSNVHLLAMSPHLADVATEKLGGVPVRFLLPTRGIHLDADQVCSLDDYDNNRPCLHGFAAQGLSDPSRRNYDRLWGDMRSLSDYFHPSPTSVKVHVLGKSETHDLEVPDDLHHIAQVDANLNFTEYYKHIYYTNAVLLYLSSDSYIIDRFSSAVIASLVTSTPIISNQAFLDAYSFLDSSHVFIQGTQETELDVMKRVLQSTPHLLMKKRSNVYELRELLNMEFYTFAETVLSAVYMDMNLD